MSSTSSALVQMAELVARLRIALNALLPDADKLPADCTLEDEVEIAEHIDTYTVLNAFLNSIEVFPNHDYSINDKDGKIKGLRRDALRYNTALKSVWLNGITAFDYEYTFAECTNMVFCMFVGVLSLQRNHLFDNSGIVNVSFPKLNGTFSSYLSFTLCTHLTTLIFDRVDWSNVNHNINNNNTSSFQAVILTNQSNLSTLGGSTITNDLLNTTNLYIYVPSALKSTYATATNWSTINASKPIRDIESNINDLRELGADFSYTPYANKKWDGIQLVTDSTIGEEVDS